MQKTFAHSRHHFLNGYRVPNWGANSHAVHPVPFTPGANSHLDDIKKLIAEQEKGERVQKWCEKLKKKEDREGSLI